MAMPMAVFAFSGSYGFSGKVLCPQIIYGSSGFSNSAQDIARPCPGAAIKDGRAINGDDAAKRDRTLEKWLKKLNML